VPDNLLKQALFAQVTAENVPDNFSRRSKVTFIKLFAFVAEPNDGGSCS